MEKDFLLKIINKLEILKSQCKPTDIWQSYLDNDDENGVFFTPDGINSVSNVLDNFIQTLIDMDGSFDENLIEDLIHKLIIEINSISHKYEGMIETNEREELVDFILTILDIIKYDYNGDITARWREW